MWSGRQWQAIARAGSPDGDIVEAQLKTKTYSITLKNIPKGIHFYLAQFVKELPAFLNPLQMQKQGCEGMHVNVCTQTPYLGLCPFKGMSALYYILDRQTNAKNLFVFSNLY